MTRCEKCGNRIGEEMFRIEASHYTLSETDKLGPKYNSDSTVECFYWVCPDCYRKFRKWKDED